MQPIGGAGYAPTACRAAATADEPAPRNVASLAALAVQGGATRYDLPQTVTIPDRSATMVMLASRDIPGEQMYLFAPDPGVPASSTHPFHVARFENRTGALLERGPIAIFEEGAYLGQGMLDALPDAATTTIPFALERALAVESNAQWAVEGARLVRMQRETLTLERYNVQRTTYRLRNGMDRAVRLLVRQPLNGARLHEPPQGTEETNGNALVPSSVPARGHTETLVTTRTPFTVMVNLQDEQAALAIEQYLREASPPDAVAQVLRARPVDLRQQIQDLSREHATQTQRRDDLQRNAEETRDNLRAIQRNPQAADLRAQLTTRLGRVATELDQITRRVVELDTQIGERRVRLAEAVRGIDVDTSRPAAPADAESPVRDAGVRDASPSASGSSAASAPLRASACGARAGRALARCARRVAPPVVEPRRQRLVGRAATALVGRGVARAGRRSRRSRPGAPTAAQRRAAGAHRGDDVVR